MVFSKYDKMHVLSLVSLWKITRKISEGTVFLTLLLTL